MIAYLKGKVINETDKSIIILVADIGYEVFLANKFLSKIKKEQDLDLYIYHKQREDAQELYGFENLEERDLFVKLISVSGVGPKSALNVMSIASIQDLKEAIVSGDADIFKKVSGIGTKTAERIIVELKTKFASLSTSGVDNKDLKNDSNLEIFEALNALGFNDNEVREVYNQIPKDLETTSDKIKFALKLLKKI
jgi:holliday junction DNA helicase RuvA